MKRKLTKKEISCIKKSMNEFLRSYAKCIEKNILEEHVDFSGCIPKYTADSVPIDIRKYRDIGKLFHRDLMQVASVYITSIWQWHRDYNE